MSDAIDKAFEAYCAERKRLLIEAGERTAAANMQRSPADFRAGWEAAIPTPPASQESAVEVKGWVYQKFDGGQVKDFVLASDYATLTAELAEVREYAERRRQQAIAEMARTEDVKDELAEVREQRDSLREECERLREVLASLIGATRHLNPCPGTMEQALAALSASGREDKNDA